MIVQAVKQLLCRHYYTMQLDKYNNMAINAFRCGRVHCKCEKCGKIVYAWVKKESEES